MCFARTLGNSVFEIVDHREMSPDQAAMEGEMRSDVELVIRSVGSPKLVDYLSLRYGLGRGGYDYDNREIQNVMNIGYRTAELLEARGFFYLNRRCRAARLARHA